jgi:hypothetical protein
LASPLYRARQFFRGFRPSLTAGELALMHSALNERERALFVAMDPRDRRHSMDMVHWLRARSAPSADLVAAALLHDVGKGRLFVGDRVAFVLLGRLSKPLRRRLGSKHGLRSREALWRLEHHPRLGAEKLAGVSGERVRALVAAHLTDPVGADEELQWLRDADNAC